MRFNATHTHLYPGLRGTILDLATPDELHSDRACLVEFSDGAATTARISRLEDGWQLDADAYCTAAGTNIEPKSWRLEIDRDHETPRFRIVKKLHAC